MFLKASLRRAAPVAALAAAAIGVLPAAASAALPPYAVNLTQFSKQVSGVAPPGVTTVTVDLLRNNETAGGNVMRNQVDTFTATVGAGQAWSGAFAAHEFSGANDQVEVNYSPAPTPAGIGASPQQLTIGSGHFLPTADQENASLQTTYQSVDLPATELDNGFHISYDGKTITCSGVCSGGFQASVAGGPPQVTATNSLTFSTPVTGGQPIEVTTTAPVSAENTRIQLSAPAPQLSLEELPLPTAPAATSPQTLTITGLPSCQAFLVIDEVVCHNLTPGSYTLTDGAATFAVTVPPADVTPPQDGDVVQSLFVPTEGGALVPGLAGGQTLTLSEGANTLTRLTVAPLKFTSSRPLGDLLNGALATTTGSCAPALFFADSGNDLCTSGGALPSPNTMSGLVTSLSENDETSLGSTTVSLPTVALQEPGNAAAVFTPFVVTAQLRYDDPLLEAVQADTLPPAVGSRPVLASTASNDKVLFSYAKLGSSHFTTLGNANTAGGVQLPPTLAIGAYDGRWTVIDSAGDSYSYDDLFFNEGSTSGNLAAPKCSTKAKLASAKNGKSSAGKVTFRCTTSANARVAVWMQRGSTVVADGSGTATRHGSVTIVVTGTGIKKGTYQLIEVVDLSGRSSEADKTLKLK